MILTDYSGAWGTLIHEKKMRSKILCQTPFNKIELYINVPGKDVMYCIGYNGNKRELYINVPGKHEYWL